MLDQAVLDMQADMVKMRQAAAQVRRTGPAMHPPMPPGLCLHVFACSCTRLL